MKAVALVVSAREHGNCYDFASLILNRMAASNVETELVNFYNCQIRPCEQCAYECLQRHDPLKGVDAPCPIHDDVRTIWEKTWAAKSYYSLYQTTAGFLPHSGLPSRKGHRHSSAKRP